MSKFNVLFNKISQSLNKNRSKRFNEENKTALCLIQTLNLKK
jgi:hypothetical protein